jgi:serine/threonine protein phosphatase PrpC
LPRRAASPKKDQVARARQASSAIEGLRLMPAGGGVAAVYSAPDPTGDGQCEDSVAVLEASPRRAVLAVADGAGGRVLGMEAAKAAIGELEAAVRRAPDGDLRGAILDGFELANRRVAELGGGAATTLAAVEIDGATVRAYHVGDSQIMVVGNRGRIRLETMPHSPVGYGVEAGLIDERDALAHDERHLVSNIVGEAAMRIEVGSSFRLQLRDTVVVGSDGLFDNLRLDEIAEHVRKGPLDRAAAGLATACHRRMLATVEGQPSKPDDVTFVLYRQGLQR